MEWFKIDTTPFIADKNASIEFAVQGRNRGGFEGLPVTVLALHAANHLDRNIIQANLQVLLASDDVMSPAFTRTILILGSTALFDKAVGLVGNWPEHDVYLIYSENHIRSGPYFANGFSLHYIYKLQEDPLEAFVMGVLSRKDETDAFQEFSREFIPVPSRHYYEQPSASKPLSGKRIGVKDVFDLRGVPTSASCRDYSGFYGECAVSAPMVQRLVDAGAVIVGKTKTSQFASLEYPRDWIEYLCPFNPRGDGYMEPDCSSTGSAAAVAGYDWLDYAVGTDTHGSMVGPAALQSVFGIRPTHGIGNLTGVVPVASSLDTAGHFARSITGMRQMARTWFGEQTLGGEKELPTRILFPEEYFATWPAAKRLIMYEFMADLEQFLGVSRTVFDLRAEWNDRAPPECARPLEKYLETTPAHIQLHGVYNSRVDFCREFKRVRGREPYVNRMVRFRWQLGESITLEDYEKARNEQELFRRFLHQHVLNERTIMVLPAGSAEVRYRDVYEYSLPEESRYGLKGFEFTPEHMSFIGGVPELVVPVGQVPATSPVTGAAIFEPVAVGILGAPKMDGELMRLVEMVLRFSSRPLAVKTGPVAFDAGLETAIPKRATLPDQCE